MRDIKFKAKRADNNEWVTGCLTRYSNVVSYITVDLTLNKTYEVASETVGQFIGLLDRNGNEIYEGDILKNIENENLFKVTWGMPDEAYAGWVAEYIKNLNNDKFDILFNTNFKKCEVVGNIYNQ